MMSFTTTPVLHSVLACLLCVASNFSAFAFPNFPPQSHASSSATEIIVGEEVEFSSAGSFDPDNAPAPLSFQWDFGDETTSREANPKKRYNAPGAFRVALTVSDGADTSVSSLSVFVLPPVLAGKPVKSSPLALSSNGQKLYVVNPDSDSVSVFSFVNGTLAKAGEVAVGKNPRTCTLTADGERLGVVCQDDNTLWVIRTGDLALLRRVQVGHQPYGVVTAPEGDRILVSNQGDATITLLDENLETEKIISIAGTPRALAITADGKFCFVTHFLSMGGQAKVSKIDLDTFSVATLRLAEDPGPDSPSSGRGVPNLLGAAAIHPSGNSVWIGGLKANVNRGRFVSGEDLVPENTVRGYFGPLDIATGVDLIDRRIDVNNADSVSAIEFSPNGRYSYVLHQGAEELSIFDLLKAGMQEPGDGTPPPLEARIPVGAAPHGLALTPDGKLAFVANFLSRSISVINLNSPTNPFVTTNLQSTAEPLSESILNGKIMFYRSKAPRHSRDGYISCNSCHPDGGMNDGLTWDFTQRGEGLRNTTDLRGKGGMQHGPVHWTANFDEIQDFENDIVRHFGGTGLAEDGAPPNAPFGPPNAGRSKDLDDLAAYLSSLTNFPASPFRNEDRTISKSALRGKALFHNPMVACSSCHADPRLTDSTLTANPSDYLLYDVGTFGPGSGFRLASTLTGLDTPSLLGVWASAPFLHNGSASALEQVITNKSHGNTSGLSSDDMQDLIDYLLTLDGRGPDEVKDADQDGMSDAWEHMHNLSAANSSDATADNDGDGHPNISEYLAGTDPHDSFSVLRLRNQLQPTEIVITFASIRGKAYLLEKKASLANSMWEPLQTYTGDGAKIKARAPISNLSNSFYRVSVITSQ